MAREQYLRGGLALGLVVGAVALRLLLHPANFAPVAAVAIFGGAMLPRKMAVWLPVTVMAVSDMVIGGYDIMFVTWGCYALIALCSSLWLQKPTLGKGALLTLGSSSFFFAVTNFAVWVASGMYAHTWAGLMQCYAMALPFFRNTVLSDALYAAILFGAFALAHAAASKLLRVRTQVI